MNKSEPGEYWKYLNFCTANLLLYTLSVYQPFNKILPAEIHSPQVWVEQVLLCSLGKEMRAFGQKYAKWSVCLKAKNWLLFCLITMDALGASVLA